MRTFIEWLEGLRLVGDSGFNPSLLSYYPADKVRNPEFAAALRRRYVRDVYRFPLEEDSFVHFTLRERIPSILASKVLGDAVEVGRAGGNAASVYAVSTSFGRWVPGVQYNHIIKGKVISLSRREERRRRERLVKLGFRVPDYGRELGAVWFRTLDVPVGAGAVEVFWSGPVRLLDVRELSSREAINLLKHAKYDVGNGQVEYV